MLLNARENYREQFVQTSFYIDVLIAISLTFRIEALSGTSDDAHKVNCIPLNKMLALLSLTSKQGIQVM